MSFGRAMRDFALPPPPSVPLPSSPPLQNKNHHCTGKTHSFQKTTAIRISRPFVKKLTRNYNSFYCIFPFWGFNGKLTYFTGGGGGYPVILHFGRKKKKETSEFMQVHFGQGHWGKTYMLLLFMIISKHYVLLDWLMNRLFMKVIFFE